MPKPWITKITVKLASQTLEAEAEGKLFHKCPCVTGDASYPTKRGKHVINGMHPNYTSKKYGVPMNYAMFFYKGQAIHQYHEIIHGVAWPTVRLLRSFSDAFGSHGCVRLQKADAKKLFEHSVDKKTIVEVI